MPVWSVMDAPASSSASAVICDSTTDSVNSFEPEVISAPSSRPALGLSSAPPPPHPLRRSAVAADRLKAALSLDFVNMMLPPRVGVCVSEALGPQEVLGDARDVVDEQGEHCRERGADELDQDAIGGQARDGDVAQPARGDVRDEGRGDNHDSQCRADNGTSK